MPIKVSCTCGQSFMAKDELKGQSLLCPKCHQPLTIPSGSQGTTVHAVGGGIDELLDEVGVKAVEGPRCLRCQAPLKPDAVLCVQCGFDLKSGQLRKGLAVRKTGDRGHGEAAEVMLARAEQTIHEDKVEEKKNRSQGLPAWAYFLALAFIVGFSVSMFTIPKQQAFEITGWAVAGTGGLVSLCFLVRILIVAFLERTSCGLLSLFVFPFYTLYYIVTRWDRCGGYLLMFLAGNAISGIGFVLAGVIAPMLSSDALQETGQLRQAPPACVVTIESDKTFLS